MCQVSKSLDIWLSYIFSYVSLLYLQSSQTNSTAKVLWRRGGVEKSVSSNCRRPYGIILKNSRIRGKCIGYGAYTKNKRLGVFGLNLRCFPFCQKIHFGFIFRLEKKTRKFTDLLLNVRKKPYFNVPPWKKKAPLA